MTGVVFDDGRGHFAPPPSTTQTGPVPPQESVVGMRWRQLAAWSACRPAPPTAAIYLRVLYIRTTVRCLFLFVI